MTIIIPSKDLFNLSACVKALRDRGDTSPIIVIWDAPKTGDPRVRDLWEVQTMLNNIDGGEDGRSAVTYGQQPFIFARNCNEGIRAASGDVLLLNDDAMLRTHNGFAGLSMVWAQNREYGLIGATMYKSGTPEQVNRPGFALREVSTVVAFACVFIPRSTIETVGLLDERFGVNAGGDGPRGYGLEDDDYCHRVRLAGLKCGVWDGCLVDHHTLPSTFRDDRAHPWDVVAHEKLFREKWGFNPPGHGYPK